MGFVKMKLKCAIFSVFAVAILSMAGSSMEVGEETPGRALDQNIGSASQALQATPARVAGSWSLAMMDGATGRAEAFYIDMSQIDDVIFGRGTTGRTDLTRQYLPVEPRPTSDEGISSMVWWLRQPTGSAVPTAQARSQTVGASGRGQRREDRPRYYQSGRERPLPAGPPPLRNIRLGELPRLRLLGEGQAGELQRIYRGRVRPVVPPHRLWVRYSLPGEDETLLRRNLRR